MKDITGQKFGKLTALYPTSKREYRKVVWHCICECGRECNVSQNSMHMGTIKSCGCIHRYVDRESVYRKIVVSRIKDPAIRKGIEFLLSNEYVYELSQMPCDYCGRSRTNCTEYIPDKLKLHYNGLDRVDSNLGYVYGNVVPCCKRCNAAKNDMTLDEFKEWIELVYQNTIVPTFVELTKEMKEDI